MSVEIERKYRINHLTDPAVLEGLTRSKPSHIEQGYLSLGTDTPWTTRVRIKTKPDGTQEATMTAKSSGTLSRTEVEVGLDMAAARELMDGCIHKVIKKRFEHDLGEGLVAEVDVFEGAHDGLVVVEVELPSVDAKTPFDGVLEDVTEDTRYSNAALSMSAAQPHRKPTC